jgi:hypothetical protein
MVSLVCEIVLEDVDHGRAYIHPTNRWIQWNRIHFSIEDLTVLNFL